MVMARALYARYDVLRIHLHDIAGTLVSDVPELVLADPLLLDAQPPKLKKLALQGPGILPRADAVLH